MQEEEEAIEVGPVCEICSATEDLEFGANPYNREIYDDFTEVWLCEGCYHLSAMEI